MAAPNPETDPGLPRRTAFQSPLANSTTASGEAPVTAAADLQPKRPDPFAKPVIRTAPAPKPAEAPAPPATAAAAPATTGADTADWGRALKPRSGTSLKFKIASLVGLVAAAGGGYFGYQKYLKPNADKAQAESAADQTEESTDDENLYSSKDLDPFAEEVVKMAGNESIDELEAELEKPRHNARPPAAGNSRHASHTPATAHKPQRKSAPVDEILDLDADEDSLANALAQSEPELDDADFPEQEEELPVSRKKKPTLASRDESRASTSHRNSRSHSAGPRLDYDPDMPSDLPDELPEEDDLTSSRMDDYEPTQPRSSSHRRTTNHQNAYHQNPGQRRGPQITHVGVDDEDTDAADPRLDGFSVDDVSSRRAYSSTRIVRSGAEDLGDGNTAPGNLPSGAGDSGDATPLHRRGAGSADTSSHTRRHTSGEFSESAGSSGPATTEIYRIQPDDNFWKISRKHYGTARYYQALMRHNQDRVADPQRLRPGTQISIPPAAYLERHYAGLIEKPAGGTASRQTASRGAASPASDGRPRFDNGSRDRRGDDTGEAAPSNASSEGYFYSKSGEPMYRVGPEDTLGSIAQKHLGRASRWTEIYEQNQDKLESPDNLKLGTVIRLPTDASRLSLVPENGRRR